MITLQRYISLLGKRHDLLIVGFILFVTALMILPLPTWLMDLMIGINFTIGVLFLLMAIYLKSPLEFSTLPTAILLATLVRVAITIATSRLILAHGDAGHIIAAFGEFVIAGNVVVGLVIFAIIAIAQFIVITKGAERVAEVAARFALDALPGKQMSIDSDLRAGDIDRGEARRRRNDLERESHYFGAMDGAMKFVKGDAIVSVIVVFVNLIGGIALGTLSKGLDINTAFQHYALLTIGDGLASQLPALLVAVAGGIIVTRVSKEDSGNLGTDLGNELVSSAPALSIAAAALFALAIVPGFPSLIFVGLGAVLAAGAVRLAMVERKKQAAQTVENDRVSAERAAGTAVAERQAAAGKIELTQVFQVRIGPAAAEVFDTVVYETALTRKLGEATRYYGTRLLAPSLTVDPRLAEGMVVFDVDGAGTWKSRMPLDKDFVGASPEVAKAAGVDVLGEARLPGIGRGLWVERSGGDALAEAGAGRLSGSEALGHVAAGLVSQWAMRSFGYQEAETWLTGLSNAGLGSLVAQVRQVVPMTRLAETIRLLLAEHVALAQARLVLEALVDLSGKVEDNALLADHIRLAMSRPISAQFADDKRQIGAFVVELDLESALRATLQEGPTGVRLGLPQVAADQLSSIVTAADTPPELNVRRPVILTCFDLRRSVRQFVVTRGLDVPVLAFEEIAPDYEIVPLRPLNLADVHALAA